MKAVELFSTLRNLTRAEKLKVMQFLISELSKDEEPSLDQGATYPIWSPFNSHTAAHQLAQLLKSVVANRNAPLSYQQAIALLS